VDELGGHEEVLVLLSEVDDEVPEVIGDGFLVAGRTQYAETSFKATVIIFGDDVCSASETGVVVTSEVYGVEGFFVANWALKVIHLTLLY
jgi:hypothetical protein